MIKTLRILMIILVVLSLLMAGSYAFEVIGRIVAMPK